MNWKVRNLGLIIFTVLLLIIIPLGIIQAKPMATEIKYNKVPGTFLYNNNPEWLLNNDLAENGAIIYQDTVNPGDVQAFFEHRNDTGSKISYGIQIYNPNNSTVNVNVTNKGMSIGYTNFDCWKQFFNSTPSIISIPKGKAIWILQYKEKEIGKGMPFSGVIRFNVDKKVEVNFYAYKSVSSVNGKGKYIGYITDRPFQSVVYKGKSDFPMLFGNFSWKIDDSTSGKLPVQYYNPVKQTLIKSDSWRTNKAAEADSDNALVSDILEYITPLKNGSTIKITNTSNLANWGVQYLDRITITNNGKKDRNIKLGIYAWGNSENGVKNVAFKTPDKIIGKSFGLNSKKSYVEYFTIYEFNVPAGRTVTREVQSIVTAPSSGDVYHYVEVK